MFDEKIPEKYININICMFETNTSEISFFLSERVSKLPKNKSNI